MESIVNKIRLFFEQIKVTPTQWITFFTAIMLVRFFLEAFSSPSSTGIIPSDTHTLLHYYLWFISLALGIIIFLKLVLREWKNAIPSLVLFGFTATWIAPVLDFIISGGDGIRMSYLFQNFEQLIVSYITYFGSPVHGITIGIHTEILIILISFSIIYYFTKRNITKTIGVTIILYSIIFIFVSAPSLLYIFDSGLTNPIVAIKDTIINSATLENNIHGTLKYTSETRLLETGFNLLMSRIYLILSIILTSILFLFEKKKVLMAILKNSRPERVLHYWLMMGFGMYIAWRVSPWNILNWDDLLVLATLLLAIYSAWMFSVCTNDISDKDIDSISNTDRPLPSHSVDEHVMRETANIFLIISLIAGYISGYYAFFTIIIFISLYYTYSMPPLRLKRVAFLSSFMISLVCVSMVIAGFFTFSQIKIVSAIPTEAIVIIIIISFLWSHIRDLKDVKGDIIAGIKTVPVIFGEVWGPRVVGIFSGISYIILALFINIPSIYFESLIYSIATYYFCIRKPYKEYPLFILYFSWVIFTIMIIEV